MKKTTRPEIADIIAAASGRRRRSSRPGFRKTMIEMTLEVE
jgi:hypothetical protein